MTNMPINALTQRPAAGPGLVDQYFRRSAGQSSEDVLTCADKFVAALEQMSPAEARVFLRQAEEQLSAHIDALAESDEGQKWLQSIFLTSAPHLTGLLQRHGNLQKNVSLLASAVGSGKLNDPAVASKVRDPLMQQLRKNCIPISRAASPDELSEKASALLDKMTGDLARTASRVYNEMAWALWSDPKSSALDKLVARDYLDAAWRAVSAELLPDTGSVARRSSTGQTAGQPVSLTDFSRFPSGTVRPRGADMPALFGYTPGSSSRSGLTVPPMHPYGKTSSVVQGDQLHPVPEKKELSLDEAFQTFANHLAAMRKDPALNAKLEGMARMSTLVVRQREEISELRQQARNETGEVIDRAAEQKFQESVQLYYLRLAYLIVADEKGKPETRAAAADYINAVDSASVEADGVAGR